MSRGQRERIAFIINPASGTNSKVNLPKSINKYLDTKQFEPSFHYTQFRSHAAEISLQLQKEGVKYIVAVGGDGTVNEIAKTLINKDTILGIIPSGSGNGLARHLNIPLSIRKSIETINNLHKTKIDTGLVNNHPFFCTSGVGFDAHIGEVFSRNKKRGFSRYIKAVLSEVFNYSPESYQLHFNNDILETNAFLITLGNASQYGNNAFICPYADIQDGLLDITIINPFPKTHIFKLLYKLFKKKIDESKYTKVYKTSSVKIVRENLGLIHIDGETVDTTQEVSFSIVPESLQVIVPI